MQENAEEDGKMDAPQCHAGGHPGRNLSSPGPRTGISTLGILWWISYANVNLGPQAGLFLPTDKNYYGIDFAVSFNPHKNIRLLLLDLGIQQGGSTSTSPPFHTDVLTSQALFGPQFTVRGRKATGFAHALIGVANTRLVETLPGGFGTVDAVRRTNLAFGAGGGLDVSWTRSIAVRVFQADYVPTRLSGTWENHFRVSTGVVFRFNYTEGR